MQHSILFLLGSKRIRVKKEELKTLLSLLKQANVTAKINEDAEVEIPILLWKKAKKAIGNNVVFYEQDVSGAYSSLFWMKKHPCVIVSIALIFSLYLLLSLYIFDVKIEGNVECSTDLLLEELAAGGLSFGEQWRDVNFSEVENAILLSSDNIAWVNINRRGLVAYVTVKEKEGAEKEPKPEGYTNIVSVADGVIEDITVTSGSAAVDVGMTVKKGQLLISAFNHDGEPTYAEGYVSARVYGTFSVFIPRSESVVNETEYKLVKKTVNIFNFSINIFKNYGNFDKEYDIIEDSRRILLAKGKPLPVFLCDEYLVIEKTEEVTHTDEELIRIAERAHQSALVGMLSGAELLSVSTKGYFTDEGYVMESSICMLKEIGEAVPLVVE